LTLIRVSPDRQSIEDAPLTIEPGTLRIDAALVKIAAGTGQIEL
jgi:hypothetical protein